MKTLLHHEKISTSIKGAVAYRIRYASHDLKGRPTESTGLVIAPEAPGENRRVMSWSHGTTGIGDAGCPSAQPDPARELELYFAPGSTTQIDYGIPGLQKSIDDGWIVVATDYQGLGTDGVHQYTVNRTNAIDAVTIVHAARELPIGAGNRFGVIGWSQGGGSAAATVELDPSDYGECEIVGTACMSPGVPIIGLKQPGLGSALGGDAPIPPDGHLFMILGGMVAAFPDTLSLDDVFTPVGRRVWDEGWNSQPVHHLSDTLGRAFKHEGPVIAVDRTKFPAWIEAFAAASATLRKPIAPVLVLRDAQDDNGPCPTSWQLGYIEAVKALGGDITETVYPNDDHFSLPTSSIDHAREWLASKF
jgi:Secretory lipase